MAVTINDLIGNNVMSDYNKVSSFPSFEDFYSEKKDPLEAKLGTESYNFDYKRPESPKMTEEDVKAYEASTPYQPPEQNEFKEQEYDFLNRIIKRPTFGNEEKTTFIKQEEIVKERDFNFEEIAGMSVQPKVEKRTGLHEFTKQDNDRLSEEELEAKLGAKSQNVVSGKVEDRTQVKEKAVVKEEKKARLNTKGKVILGVYITMILIVAILIGVHAGDINNGVAVAPTSNSVSDVYVQTVDYMDAADTIMTDIFDAIDFNSIQNLN